MKNLWIRRGTRVIRNPLHPLETDLDRLPFPDMSPDGKYAIHQDTLVRNDPTVSNYGGCYDIITARGCPFHCTFCCEHTLKKLYEGQRFLRRRSPENVLAELREAKERFDSYRINIWDEVFSLNLGWIERFTASYREEIGIPYWCYVHPKLSSPEILQALKEGGVLEVRMGVQAGSERINRDIFLRPTSNEEIREACRRLHAAEIPYSVDLISNNPYETEEDRRETLELLLSLPRPLVIGSDTVGYLTFYPNHEITLRAESEGKDTRVDERAYGFYNRLYLLAQYRSPNLVRRLSGNRFLRRFPRLLQAFFPESRPLRFLRRFVPKGLREGLKRVAGKSYRRGAPKPSPPPPE